MKRSNNKFLIALVLVLILINLGTLSFIWFKKPKRHDPMRMLRGPKVERYLQKELNLNPEQSRTFSELREQHFQSTTGLVTRMHNARTQLVSLMAKEADTVQIDSLITMISSTQAMLDRYNFQHLKKLRSVCDDTQKPKFDTLMLKVVNRMKPFRHARKKRRK